MNFIHRFEYEFVAVKGSTFNETAPVDYNALTDGTSISIHINELASLVTEPIEFTVGVRIRTTMKYQSSTAIIQLPEIRPLSWFGEKSVDIFWLDYVKIRWFYVPKKDYAQ